jgi:hypothetical protein
MLNEINLLFFMFVVSSMISGTTLWINKTVIILLTSDPIIIYPLKINHTLKVENRTHTNMFPGVPMFELACLYRCWGPIVACFQFSQNLLKWVVAEEVMIAQNIDTIMIIGTKINHSKNRIAYLLQLPCNSPLFQYYS